jgi:transcription initiation factor TFIIB
MAYLKPFPLASPPKRQQAAFAPDLSVRLICPDCRDPNPTIVEDFKAGDPVCAGCGLVLPYC